MAGYDYALGTFRTQLLDLALDWLWENGAERVWLSTGPLTRASRFYEMRGWVCTGNQIVVFIHHERRDTGALFEAVDRRDVRMVQRRERLGFPLKAREPLGVLGERIGQDLDRHLAAEAGVCGAIDRAHPALADLRGDVIDAEARAGSEGQTAVDYMGERGCRTDASCVTA